MQEDPTSEGLYLLDKKPIQLAGCVPSHNNWLQSEMLMQRTQMGLHLAILMS